MIKSMNQLDYMQMLFRHPNEIRNFRLNAIPAFCVEPRLAEERHMNAVLDRVFEDD